MNKKFTRILAALALLAFLALPMGMRGQAPVGTTLWAEDFSGFANNVDPSGEYTTNSHTGTTVYGGVTITYSKTNGNGGGTTQTYTSGGPNSNNNLLIAKSNGSFTISGISTGEATELTVSYAKSGSGVIAISTSTTGVTVDGSTSGSTITTNGASTIAITFTNTGSSNLRIDDIEISVKTAGSSGNLEDSDLALVDAPVELEFDLYDNANAQSISYTTSSTGAVTVSQNNYITTTVNANNTITVTPVAVTNGTQTITVNQAADNTYAAGSVTFTVDIENSTPTTSSDVTFNAATDTGTSPLVKDGVTFACSNGVLNNGSEYRLYKNSVTTFSVSEGNITQIAFTGVSGNPASGFANQTGWTTSGSNGTWSGSATSVSFTASGAQVRATQIVVTVETSGTPAPSISANNVDLDYDAEEGTITYSINNPVEGGSITASTNAQWLMVDDEAQSDPEGSFYFTCGPNSNFYAHSATVTLTYTYGDSKATVTKDVTVTQAKDPDANGSTSEYPITVSEAIEAIDEVGTVSSIYVGGIVSSIVSAYNNSYVTFDMYDATGDEYSLRAYHCEGEDADEVAVGDEVVVYGNLMLYNNSIYELASGCQLVSLTHHVVPAITVDPSTVNATAAETEGTLTVTYTGIQTELDPKIYWFESDGTTEATYNHDWIQTEINADYNVYYVIGANDGAARTAYFKVFGLDEELNDVYSGLVTVSQAAAPQQYTLTVAPFENLEIVTFVNDEMVMETAGTINNVNEGDQIMLSVVADEGYVMETLLVNGVDHVNDIESDYTYSFEMPAGNVTISATAVEYVGPVYVRITSLDQLTDGSKVIIAARYDEEHANGYYAMKNTTSGKPTGEAFSSEASGNDEILPADITSSEDDYYWTVNVTNDGYTFTNANNQLIGYTSSTNFATGGNNTTWTITRETAIEQAMVAEYEGFVIRNGNTNTRAFAFNGNAFGPYSTTNMTTSGQPGGYNFCLDFFVQPATETYHLTITGYGNSTIEGWHLIASPVSTTPDQVTNMLTDETTAPYSYDLYRFNQTAESEWENYHQHSGDFNIVPGTGYLYANKGDVNNTPNSVTLTFTGVPYSGNGEVDLVYSEENEDENMHGWNLIGNPFSTAATLNMPFFKMNGTGSGFTSQTANSSVAAMEGVLVYAYDDGASQPISTATFTAAGRSNSESAAMVNIDVVSSFGDVMDNAIVNFNEGIQLPKFYFGTQNANIYIPQGNKEYAIVSTEAQGEMPVNFKAAENGTYTLTVNPEGVEMNYLHLIDNMTGADIDLLAATSTGSVATYTFNASTTDYSSRFRLVFAANNEDGVSTGSTAFAFYSNGTWVINNTGEATLQVVDVNGRILSSETVNGSVSKAINAPAGVYMLRLINGNDVKTQKILAR